MKKLLFALALIGCFFSNSFSQDTIQNKKIEQEVNIGVSVNAECFGGGVGYNIGKRLDKYFVLGGGADIHFRNTCGCVIPLYANFKTSFPLNKSDIKPFVSVRLGGAVAFWDDWCYPAVYTSLLTGIQTHRISIGVGFNLISDAVNFTETCFKFGVGYVF